MVQALDIAKALVPIFYAVLVGANSASMSGTSLPFEPQCSVEDVSEPGSSVSSGAYVSSKLFTDIYITMIKAVRIFVPTLLCTGASLFFFWSSR